EGKSVEVSYTRPPGAVQQDFLGGAVFSADGGWIWEREGRSARGRSGGSPPCRPPATPGSAAGCGSRGNGSGRTSRPRGAASARTGRRRPGSPGRRRGE